MKSGYREIRPTQADRGDLLKSGNRFYKLLDMPSNNGNGKAKDARGWPVWFNVILDDVRIYRKETEEK